MVIETKERKAMKIISALLVLLINSLLLVACTNNHEQAKSNGKKDGKNSSDTQLIKEWKLPIVIPEGEFSKVDGWLAENQLIYTTNQEQTSNVYRYNLLSGDSVLIYKSNSPISSVKISPSKDFLLIQSLPSTYQGLMTIVDLKGSELLKTSFTYYDVAIEWNPYDESKIFVSKFNEDWTFQMLLLDIKNKKTTEISLPQPFIKWTDKNDIAFINWDDNIPSLFAPLLEKNLGAEKEESLFPSVYQFTAFHNLLMTITVNEQEQSKAIYSFFDKQRAPIFTFSIPQLTKFSDWLVPFFDYNESTDKFITFEPVKSVEVDAYSEGFKLVSYSLKNRSNNLILDGLKNEPLSISPLGDVVLYGNQFEKIIDLKTKKIYELFKEK
ncbi:MAG TPA: hypothetical protein VGI04_04100 [Neobacillus sp.]